MNNSAAPNIYLKVTGPAFQPENAVLSSTVKILTGYEEALSFCIQLAAVSHNYPKELQYRFSIKLKKVEFNSLDVQTYIDLLAALAPIGSAALNLSMSLAPEVLKEGWDIFSSAYQLIVSAIKHFNKHKEPIAIEVANSPGAFIQVFTDNKGDISQLTITPNVLQAATAIHSNLEKIAKPVVAGEADEIKIDANHSDNQPISINRSNCADLKMASREFMSEEPIQIIAHMYRLNTKTKTGKLELADDPDRPPIPFIIEGGNLSDYVDALKEEESKFIAKREMSINALGETKVSRFILIGVLHGDAMRG